MAKLTMPLGERDHIQGRLDAPLTLVEYGDYECPYCGAAYPDVKMVQVRLGDQLCFAFRNFPLTEVHPHASIAAEAAEAAGEQGKFWEMHDMLYEHQNALEPHHLQAYAVDLGLDLAQFARDLTEHRYVPRIREDFMSGIRSGVNGTPTFFINGIRHDGPNDLEALFAALQRAQRHGDVARAR